MINIFKHLLPTGRAWRITLSTQLRQFFNGLSGFTTQVRAFVDNIYFDINPQKTRELVAWESQFGLLSTGQNDQDRRDRLSAAWKITGGQDPRYIEDMLRGAGFDVYVHEWWEPIVGRPGGGSVDGDQIPVARDALAILVTPNYPLVNKLTEATIGGQLIGSGHNSLYCGGNLAFAGSGTGNSVDYKFKEYFVPADPAKYPFFLYIGGAVFPAQATVPLIRKDEFEDLCLKICPAEQWLGMLVIYA